MAGAVARVKRKGRKLKGSSRITSERIRIFGVIKFEMQKRHLFVQFTYFAFKCYLGEPAMS